MQDSIVVIEQNKSGFERPGDLEFEDYSQGINRASSDSSLGTPKGHVDLPGKNRSKNFWLFSKKSKVRHLLLVEHINLIEPNNVTLHWQKVFVCLFVLWKYEMNELATLSTSEQWF